MNPTLTKLSERHIEWIKMARSLSGKGFIKLSMEDANDLVQEMYLKLSDINLERIMYDETSVNTMYIYLTLRNLYYSNHQYHSRFDYYEYPELFSLFNDIEYNEADIDLKQARIDLQDKITEEMKNNWHHYDQKLFKIIFTDGISMRRISREADIGKTSIVNSVNNGKDKLRNKFIDDYNKLIQNEKDR